VGAPGFLGDLRAVIKDGSFRPLPVRERLIPKPPVIRGSARLVTGFRRSQRCCY
jgi:hypothetical protein